MADEISRRLVQYMEERIRKTGEPAPKVPVPYSIRCFSDGHALLENGGDFDILFLDIQMRSPDGMETARRLRRQGNQCLLIFVTVLRECVFDAFSVEAYDYLVKPLEDVRFRRTMDRALDTLKQRAAQQAPPKKLLIQKDNSCEIIPMSQILYVEVLGRKIYLHQLDEKVTVYCGRLKDLERRVDESFFKCHRSYLVNLAHVRGCHDGRVFLAQGKEIPVSRLREHDLTQALLHYMKNRAQKIPG